VPRSLLLITALAGSAMLIVSEFLTLRELRIITVVKESLTGGSHHAYALAVIGVVAAVMAFGAFRGDSRPAGYGLLALALAAVAVIAVADVGWVNEEGFIGQAFEDAVARPKEGFYVETLGAALLLLSAVANLVLARRPAAGAEKSPPA